MSDEEIYFDDDDDQGKDQQQDDDLHQEEEEETLEMKYERAKGLLGFSDLEAIDLFYDIYCDGNADLKLQGKSLKRAAITLSTTDDYERILASLSDVFAAYKENTIDSNLCTKIVRRMMSNIRNEQALTDFLNQSAENVDRSNMLQLFIDVKIRQAELSLKIADYNKAKDQLAEVEQYVDLTSENNDRQVMNAAVHILLLKIELADVFTKDEEEIFGYYNKLKSIPNMTFTQDRQKAVLKKIEAQKALSQERDFNKAKSLFHEAFRDFDRTGSDKRLDCLPFLALAIMCSKDQEAKEFIDSQITPYINHPLVAPLKQLLETFKANNYVKFVDLLDSAQKVFQQKVKDAEVYFKLLDEVRIFVLRCNIKEFCPMYKKLEFKFLSTQLKCKDEESRQLVLDLIISRELNALVDRDSNLILIQDKPKRSIYLQNIELMLESLGDTIRKQTRREKTFRFT